MVMRRGGAFVDTATSGELIIATMEMPSANGLDAHRTKLRVFREKLLDLGLNCHASGWLSQGGA